MSKHRYFSFGPILRLWPGVMLLAWAPLSIAAASAEENPSTNPVSQSPSGASGLVRELAGFKSLADQIKIAFEEGRTAVARVKIRKLESSWEQAEPRLHFKYPKQSQILDESLDRVIAAFSQSNPDPKQARPSLDELIATVSYAVAEPVQLQQENATDGWRTNDWYTPPRSPAFNDLFGS
ncbi:MAG TPA: hypothetical protein VE242_14225 [Chthoniobacterales bacterium]|nr:hypothetical protein [Chthoniobacterales bacterium]